MAAPTKPKNGDRASLEQLRTEVSQQERALAQIESEHARAQTEVTEIEDRLREAGFDPRKPLDKQIVKKEQELDDLIGTIDGVITDLRGRLA